MTSQAPPYSVADPLKSPEPYKTTADPFIPKTPEHYKTSEEQFVLKTTDAIMRPSEQFVKANEMFAKASEQFKTDQLIATGEPQYVNVVMPGDVPDPNGDLQKVNRYRGKEALVFFFFSTFVVLNLFKEACKNFSNTYTVCAYSASSKIRYRA